jgi:glutathione-regulated potassium-efflux system ancillary protein KefC
MDHDAAWLTGTLIYLAAAVLAVPLARALGLSSIIGYLAAGVAIGPWGLGLVSEPSQVLQFAEFGVVLMLFLLGLELEPKRLWAMRRPIFGWGGVQLVTSAALIGGMALLAGASVPLAVVAGLGLALSSTAIGLGTLAERNLTGTTAGASVLAVALLQDIAALPILGLVPLLGSGAEHAGGSGWTGVAKVAAVIAGIVLGGRLALRPTLRWIARSRTPEIFTAAALLLVVATAAVMQSVGLSMALGAFLAGVLLAESEYRRELETDLEPFKGLLLGLFFIAVGMSVDFAVVARQPLLLAGLVLGLLTLKSAVLAAMARGMGIPLSERPVFVLLLAQGGEFGFVVFQQAAVAGAIDRATSSLLVAAVTLSMLLTPLLLVAADRWLVPRIQARRSAGALPELLEEQEAPVIIAGFGRYGQIVGRLLNACGLHATVLDHDAEQVETVRRFGWPVHYGDATRLDLLRMAGGARACVIVVAIDDVAQSLRVVDLAREHFPQAVIVARARNVTHYYGLRERGVQHIERETFDAAIASGRSVLEQMGWSSDAAHTQAARFRAHSIELLERMAPHFKDEAKLIALAKQGRRQLEELWAREREEAAATASGRPPPPPTPDR